MACDKYNRKQEIKLKNKVMDKVLRKDKGYAGNRGEEQAELDYYEPDVVDSDEDME